MLTKENKRAVKEIVDLTIDELKKRGLIRNVDNDVAYAQISRQLVEYYRNGEKDIGVSNALRELSDDIYIDILIYFYKERYTIYNIADKLNVEASTVVRNKKRLCLMMYDIIYS